MRLSGQESSGWEETLKEYIQALQNHDYMEERSKSRRDPFLATGEYAWDNYILNCNIDDELANKKLTHVASLQHWEPASTKDPNQQYESICGTRDANIAKAEYLGFKDRVLLAAVGGAFLIGPMWLMVLQSALYTTLITTTAFVTGFGILMAYLLEEGKDVLGSTAAYAAVLVVFVGTSTQSPTE
ncbi:hypothetical protein CONLIGDRAFT_656437 [Coniochaeta ligniaria NRRL 30616]|uniref:DUF6594 domain-containing protein n=1 Tax=Coniochaeta ligniaria NRRL 30616 TaxID=1408157 RepID=A0A1J7IE05_9PEZI|nr:hypothetical protein CONLIGDRAFT_656437 [Coniochaeta ligniaria NRRL 30616]